ncbi:MAG: outer membrane protein transport protein, partial [Candidatus Omnitrophica bacterium]|nr:outer membrane protein transport protein [Candidatus Omnitrophota bacterium]
MMINPAGITKIGNRIDLATEIAHIDMRKDTSQAPFAQFANAAGWDRSKADTIFIPHFGFAGKYRDSDVYYGLAAGVVSGLEVDYKNSRLSQAVTNNDYDRHVELYVTEFVPTVAYKPTEQLSVGLSGVAVLSRLKADIANSSLNETVGRDNGDHAWGIGFNVGTLYDVNDFASVGLSFKSMRWNERFNGYNDTLEKLNNPPEYIAGVALKPTDNLLFESNVKYIDWRWVDVTAKSPDHGGYGWENQWVFGFGAQYRAFERLKLRLGYSYGQSPIHPDVVYANVLSGLISEHHLGVGVGYQLSDHIELNAGWLHVFKNTIKENGMGDSKSRRGEGAQISLEIDSLYAGISYLF